MRHLDQPAVVRTVQLVVDHPRRQLVPLLAVAAVDRDAVLGVLVLRLGEVVKQFGGELGEVAAVDGVVGLEEHLAQLRLAERVVPERGRWVGP